MLHVEESLLTLGFCFLLLHTLVLSHFSRMQSMSHNIWPLHLIT
jgi:hypothetical protein